MEQEVNMKITCIAIKTGEEAGKAFLTALSNFNLKVKESELMKKRTKTNQVKEHGGKMVKVKDLRKDGSQIEFVDMGNDELKNFRRYARKYGVTYSMEKNKESDPPTYLIFFKAKDSQLITRAVSEYVKDMMTEKDKEEGIKHKLSIAKEKMNSQVKKVRNKEQIR